MQKFDPTAAQLPDFWRLQLQQPDELQPDSTGLGLRKHTSRRANIRDPIIIRMPGNYHAKLLSEYIYIYILEIRGATRPDF